jgi:hypothetical protein
VADGLEQVNREEMHSVLERLVLGDVDGKRKHRPPISIS